MGVVVLRHRWIAVTGWSIPAVACALALSIVACFLAPPLAAAQSIASNALVLPSSIRLQLTPCNSANYDADELAELLRAELLELGVERLDVDMAGAPADSATPRGLALIHLSCGSVRATLAVELADLVGGNRVSREVIVDAVPPSGRTRALSHAIAQLVESSWSLLATHPSDEAADGGATRMPSSVRSALRRRLSANLAENATRGAALSSIASTSASAPLPGAREPVLALRVSLLARAFPSSGSGVTGFAIAAAPRLAPRLELAFDLDAMYGRQAVDLGGPIGSLATLWLSAGTTLYFATATEPRFRIGPSLRAAYVHVLTSSDDERFLARDGGGWVAMFGASSLLEFELTPAWDLFFGADIAYVPGGLSFRTDAARSVRFSDLALAVRLGVSWNR